MRNGIEIKLPNETCSPASGPVFRYAFEELTVDYDVHELDGTIVWTRLVFAGVAAIKYAEEGCCDVDKGPGFHHIMCWESSPWLEEVNSTWQRNYPRADPDAGDPWRHYHLECDHAGGLHVIASHVEIIENPELDSLNMHPPCR